MAQSSTNRVRVVGDYLVWRQIGFGSFSVVWHAKHRVHGTEVAIKEIVTGRLSKKLEESLMSEIDILRNINHPNIIQLYDMIQEPGKIHLVLEYCEGGDLSKFIQRRHGRIPEATAKHFMLQLASGLKILRDNNLIHRDLKPQNLLLSTNADNSVLKIADFGFARSLQPRNLAETLCGSPLYMAPEIMQLQKYDAKADLWSVGAILFQLVTGKTPFTGNNQIQLLQNIMRSTELYFPSDITDLSSDCIDLCRKLLRRNPVERLTFEEFFNHPFLSQKQPDEMSSSQEDLPFTLDDDSSGPDGSPSHVRRSPLRSTYGFSLDTRANRREVYNASSNIDISSKYSSTSRKPQLSGFTFSNSRPSEGYLNESLKSMDHGAENIRSEVVDSLELVDQDYVLVSSPPVDVSSSTSAPSKLGGPPLTPGNNINSTVSAPVPIIVAATSKEGHICSLGSHSTAPSGTSLGSLDIRDASERPSTDCMTRIKSLQSFASTITELVNDKVEAGKQLEAFTIQLVILAIWKQALDICHTQAASAIEGSPTQETMGPREITNKNHASPDIRERLDTANSQLPQDVCSQIERAFLLEIANAEELSKVIESGNIEMPDAMEAIYQSALAFGRNGAVDECMGNTETAAVFYSKAVRLLAFLLVEGPSLIINPPFYLTKSDRYRLQTYIDVLNNRQSHSRSQRMALLKCEDQHSPP